MPYVASPLLQGWGHTLDAIALVAPFATVLKRHDTQSLLPTQLSFMQQGIALGKTLTFPLVHQWFLPSPPSSPQPIPSCALPTCCPMWFPTHPLGSHPSSHTASSNLGNMSREVSAFPCICSTCTVAKIYVRLSTRILQM